MNLPSILSQINHHPSEISQEFYQQLIKTLVQLNQAYYLTSQPLISDLQYDQLFDYLKQIESVYPEWISPLSPTQRLVGQRTIQEGFEPATHRIPLLSLQNTYNPEDIKERHTSLSTIMTKQGLSDRTSFHVEPKFDGISVELIYQDGIFTQAITRGDGTTGDDITHNVLTITNLPHKLHMQAGNNIPESLHIRAEIVMPLSAFSRLNTEKIAQGEKPFVNPRNACSGSIKLLDPKEVAKRGLQVRVYGILYPEHLPTLTTQQEVFQQLSHRGLPVYPREQTLSSIDDVISLTQDPETKSRFNNQDCEFDGLVIKLNNLSHQQLLGSTNHHPRRAIAYKFPAQQVSTRLLDVGFQVGRTGILTPVAHLEPVQLSGVTISRASLHNEAFIRLRDIHLHDAVILQRSGEVIPYIIGVDYTQRDVSQISVISFPHQCPRCSSPTSLQDEARYCTNPHCPAIIIEQIRHRASKDCLDIQGLGDRLIEDLVNNKLINGIPDLYRLEIKRMELVALPGVGQKTIDSLLQQLHDSKTRPLRRLLHALGIPNVGKKLAQDLQSSIQSLHRELSWEVIIIALGNQERLRTIYGVGEQTIVTIQEFLETHRDLIRELEHIGIQIIGEDRKKTSGPLSGQSYCITGTFQLTREEIIERLSQLGAIYSDTVSSKLSRMLIGDKPGSKATKAEKLGIPIKQLSELLPNLPSTPTETTHKPQQERLF